MSEELAYSNTVLVVEDETPIREMLVFNLKHSGYSVREAENYEQMKQHIETSPPDLILLDWMLPGGRSGIEITKQLKKNTATRDIPIIMLTAKAEEENKIKGFDVGADDYVTKPFSPRELMARIKAVLRRGLLFSGEGIIQFADMHVDLNNHTIQINNENIKLNPLEYKLLVFFITHKDRVYSRPQLLDNVWGADTYVDERTVDVEIKRLRQALRPFKYHTFIQTVRGCGYRFSEKQQ